MSFFPRRRQQRRQRSSLGNIVNSIKNSVDFIDGISAATVVKKTIAIAKDNPATTIQNEVKRGSLIKAIWLEFWYYGTSPSNTNDIMDAYVIKNPGNNLTDPDPGTVGTSNEKKFVFREWRGIVGNKSLGGFPYRWSGWLRIPKRYQRMGTDDILKFVLISPTTGNLCTKFIYKWYT